MRSTRPTSRLAPPTTSSKPCAPTSDESCTAGDLVAGVFLQCLNHLLQLGHPFLEILDLLTFRIGKLAMFQHSGGNRTHAYDASGNADHRRIIRHGMYDNRTGPDFHIAAD